jgi:CO/xanthine dehydrogenase FAD-binding subunit
MVIKAYHRPENKKEAIALFRRHDIESIFVLGSSQYGNVYDRAVDVVDLQDIRLEQIENSEEGKKISCFAFLSDIASNPHIIPELKQALMHDYTENQRNSMPLAGLLFTAKGNSISAAVLLACDANITLFVDEQKMDFDDWLIKRKIRGYEICERVEINTAANITMEWVSKTPGDFPELVVILAQWKSGRTRLVIGGSEISAPQVVFDGTEQKGIEQAAKNACSHLFNRSIHKEYLTQTSQTLIQRFLTPNN